MNTSEALKAVRAWKKRFELMRERARAEGNAKMEKFCDEVLDVYEKNSAIINSAN